MNLNILDNHIRPIVSMNHQLVEINPQIISELRRFEHAEQFYEVVRCTEGVLMFFDDHLQRLVNSSGKAMPDRGMLTNDAIALKDALNLTDGNLKIVVSQGLSLIYASAFYYPVEEEYRQGVPVGLLSIERSDPNIKMIRPGYKEAILAKLESAGPFGRYFETLLVSASGKVTEGSRSNAFFVIGSSIYTAPSDVILEGITRKYVLKAIHRCGYRVVQEAVDADVLSSSVESAFLTGTSIGVLPIRSVEGILLASGENTAVMNIRTEYEKIYRDHCHKNLKKYQ